MKVMRILRSYIKSTDPSIRMMSRSIAFEIGPYIDKGSLDLLCLSEEDADELIRALSSALRHPELTVTTFSVSLTLKELINEIDHSLIHPSNCSLLLDKGILNSLPLLLKLRDNKAILRSALTLFWHLSVHHVTKCSPLHTRGLKDNALAIKELCNGPSGDCIAKCIHLSLCPEDYSGEYFLPLCPKGCCILRTCR